MSIYLTAIVKSKIEKKAALKAVLLNMVSHSRKERACIQYDLHEAEGDDLFIFHEEWLDQNGLDEHNQQSYILDFVRTSAELTEEIIIYKTEKLV
ncbi:antibiotic biosynthesis monooxygenase [Pedobacter chinensis]|uniref:Antibiotic biosynthesis monooxygenase n=1 Tax=Pedobacter chinensis TaxID=2282421 RepID=A0A369PXI2_9SPHI|nr:antibiotic biosynthesis monooxygenase [Pedobacter chinensis]RDC56982.1 antibiotic biosynthesis monooxygenase [Pedobacter chinensis]